ncbi:MAG: ABC transporter ATP-binding protein [Alphaproteobacteria bacterium]|nr:ABC transporter ATP-binding protein [Alphaproteobacteria bacterium]
MIVFLSYGWYQGLITLGDFAFIGAICFYVRRTVWVASIQLLDFFKEVGTAHEALSLLSQPQSPEEESHQSILTTTIPIKDSSIELKNINFSYDNKQTLFKALSLSIPAGQKLGIVGPSGAGKTSFVHLLLGLYKPKQGSIQISNWEAKSIPLELKRELFSYVPQSPSLLHCSIYDNIAFGKPQVTPEEVYEAAEICMCDEFIVSLKEGYQTIIGEGGYKLSGGQKQRIALARAYLKKAPIFILDEATSGLELALEESLLERLCNNLKTHTLLVISHRVSTLRKLDRILEFEMGNIVSDSIVNGHYHTKNDKQSLLKSNSSIIL